MKVLLTNRGFRFLIIGQTLSTLGDRALIIAFGIWVKELTGSNAAAGGAFFFVALPFLFAPFAGVLIDRFPRRQIFIVTNLAMAGVMPLSLLVRGEGQVWLLYAIILCYGVAGVIITATQAALVTAIVDEDALPDANGLLQTSADGVKLLAPLFGAALFTVAGGHVVALLDAATFLAAAACVWLIQAPGDQRHVTGALKLREEVLSGLRHIYRSPSLRTLVGALGLAMLVTGFSQTLIFSIVDDGLHRAPAFVGVLSSVQGAGAVCAGLAAGAAIRRVGDLRTVMLGIALVTMASLVYLAPAIPPVAVGAFLFGFGMCWTTVGLVMAVQRRTPDALRGRALTAAMGVISTPQTASIALGAALSLVVDYRILLTLMAAVTAVCAIWLQRVKTEPQPQQPPQKDLDPPEPESPAQSPETKTAP
ncbi:Na+/melibiose symporter-like transporter [Actinomadura luteofluorescens]|uniref:Na+/melibiose symporter-like transporter n=1 Tax=Actinomadura luteofluorescens TaxID=46163 RepID=A0A7Y9JKC0_9ACTN|nr:MFS transporter [Actinomadura luteofluorescens]NYD50289.1 Na+/melibiose symporter-like transporter [Actinomadura luteofluorescens]